MESERISVRRLLAKGATKDDKGNLCTARVSEIVQQRLMPSLRILRTQLEEMRLHGLDVDNLIAAAEQSVQREFGSLAVDLGTILNLGEHNRDEELAADTEEAALFGTLPHPKLAQAKLRAKAKADKSE